MFTIFIISSIAISVCNILWRVYGIGNKTITDILLVVGIIKLLIAGIEIGTNIQPTMFQFFTELICAISLWVMFFYNKKRSST